MTSAKRGWRAGAPSAGLRLRSPPASSAPLSESGQTIASDALVPDIKGLWAKMATDRGECTASRAQKTASAGDKKSNTDGQAPGKPRYAGGSARARPAGAEVGNWRGRAKGGVGAAGGGQGRGEPTFFPCRAILHTHPNGQSPGRSGREKARGARELEGCPGQRTAMTSCRPPTASAVRGG